MGSHILSPIAVGTKVLVQHPLTKRWSHKAIILSVLDSGRSYNIRFMDGRETCRNRRFLRPVTYADADKNAPLSVKTDLTATSQKSILKSPSDPAFPRRSLRLQSKKSISYAL